MNGVLEEGQFQRIVERVAAATAAERIIAFGPYGCGALYEEGELNLCVVVSKAGPWLQRAHALRQEVPVSEVAFEPLVVTPAELEELRRAGNPQAAEALSQGKVVYERQ